MDSSQFHNEGPESAHMKGLYKADLHVHSVCSDHPSRRSLLRLRCPESYAEPLTVYRRARERGMDFVTITDHDTLEGSLRIAEQPGTFLSAEVTASFPDHDCAIHVVVLGVDEGQFAGVLAARENVYELVDLLHWEEVCHFVAHPLYPPSGTLTTAVFEKLLLLFDAFEVRNGARPARLNDPVEAAVTALTPWHIEELANRYAMEARGRVPWLKARVAGSDDHTGMFVGSAHTVVPCSGTIESFLDGIRGRIASPAGHAGDPTYLAHSIYQVGREHVLRWQTSSGALGGASRQLSRWLFGRSRGETTNERLDEFTADCLHALRTALPAVCGSATGLRLEDEVRATVAGLWRPSGRADVWQMNERIRRVAADIVRAAATLHGARLAVAARGLRPIRAGKAVAGLAAVHALSLPYYIAYHDHSGEQDLVAELERRFSPARQPSSGERLVLFTDTLDEVNGVALSIGRMMGAAEARGTQLLVARCGPQTDGVVERDGQVSFPSCAELPIPHYEELVLRTPSLLDVLDFLHRHGATAIHASTPGPMGVTALLAARLLQLPIAATYHTDVPTYVRILTGRRLLGEAAWLYIMAFYRLVDEVLVPSAHSRRQLIARGLPAERVAPLPRWVDTDLFTPDKRDLGSWAWRGVGPGVKLLYAGRVSREKNLELLADAFDALLASGRAARLVVAGDGPYRAEFEHRLRGRPATFLGLVPQAELATIYASADLFVFPSTTDTFGNVVLEAQAAGLPVIVSDVGGPAELVQHGNTGLVVRGNDRRALLDAMTALLDDPGRLALMGVQARRYVLANQLPIEHQFETVLRGPRQTRRRLWRRRVDPELA